MASNRSYIFSNQCLRPHVQNGSGHWLAKKESSNLPGTTFSRAISREKMFMIMFFFLSQNQFITSKNKMLNIAVIVENITNHNRILTPLLKPKFPRPPLEIYVLALDSHTNVADVNRMRGTPLIPYYRLESECVSFI